MKRRHLIELLHAQVSQITGGSKPARQPERQSSPGAMHLGEDFLSAGLPSSSLHEIEGTLWDAETGAAASAFAALCVAKQANPGMILWAVRDETPFPPRLASLGLDPDRVIFCRCRNDAEALAALEEALRTKGIAAAIGEIANVTLTQSRRLHLICESSGAMSLLLRRNFHGTPPSVRKAQGSAAMTRWRIQFAPTNTQEPGLGPPRWRLDLLYCRGGMPASFLVEWNDETGDLRMVAKLADHEALPQRAGLRRTG
jgi:protein ImuA